MQKQIDSLQATIDPGPPGRSAPGPQTDVRFEGQVGSTGGDPSQATYRKGSRGPEGEPAEERNGIPR
jgi:hypothetical protein